MTEIRPGDVMLIPNISAAGRDGIALATAIGRNGSSESSASCYDWDGSSRRNSHPLENDRRHFVTIDPFTIKEVSYQPLTVEGKLAARIRGEMRALRACILPVSNSRHRRLVRDAEALCGGKIPKTSGVRKAKVGTSGARGGHPPTREQIARGLQAEDEMLRRLQRPAGFDGLTLVADRRNSNCGYDFLCEDSAGTVEVEVKGFAPDGQLFLTENEFQRARSNKKAYRLVGFLDNGDAPPKWLARSLKGPFFQLHGLGAYETQTVTRLRVDPSLVKWDC